MDQPPPIPEEPPIEAPQARMSVWARILNVFAVPGEVFEDVRVTRPSAATWLVPVFLYAIIGAIASILIMSQPAIIQQIHEQQAKVFDDRVKAGKMTREQADQALAAAERYSGPTTMKIFGAMGAVVFSFISVFWWAFLLWLIGGIGLKTWLSFMKLVEVAALASVITTLAAIIKMLLVVSLSNPLASPSLALLLKNPDPHNKLFMVLNLVDIMTIWVLIVRSIGLAKLSSVRFGRAAAWVFGVWVLGMGLLAGISTILQGAFHAG